MIKSTVMTKSNAPANDIRDLLAFKLARVTTLSDRIGQKLISQHLGVSLREFRTLGTIAYLGMPTASLIARESFLDHAQVSRIIAGLIGKGLIARIGGTERGGVLELTEDGRALVENGMPFAQQQNTRLAKDMPEEKQAELLALIDELLGHAQQVYRDVNGEIAGLIPAEDQAAEGEHAATGVIPVSGG